MSEMIFMYMYVCTVIIILHLSSVVGTEWFKDVDNQWITCKLVRDYPKCLIIHLPLE